MTWRWLATSIVALLLTMPAHAAELAFRRLSIDTGGDIPRACLTFDKPLDPSAAMHYGDYLTITPKLRPAVQVAGNQLCLSGLDYAASYTLTLAAGLPSQDGSRLASPKTLTIELGDRPARIAFGSSGYLLSRDTAHGVPIQTVNVQQLRVHVLRISDQTAPQRLDAGATSMDRYSVRALLKQSASMLWSGTMDVAARHNATVTTAFPLATILPSQPGAYLVIAEDAARAAPDSYYTADSGSSDNDSLNWETVQAQWVLVTDIALTTVQGHDGLHVTARSLRTAQPLQNVRLKLVAAGQDVLGEATTDADGQAAFPPGLTRGTGAEAPSRLIAHGPNNDFAPIDLTRPAFDLSDRGVSGRAIQPAVDAFLYADRGVYRPGETIHLTALLRLPTGDALTTAPPTIILRRPDGVEAQRLTPNSAGAGGYVQPITLSPTASRGLWTIEALVDPASPPVARLTVDVQDFVPQTLQVSLATTTPVLAPGQPIAATVTGRFLYGAPAAGLGGEADLTIMRDDRPVASLPGYQFGLADDRVEQQVQTLTLPDADSAGRAMISDTLKAPKATSAPLRAILRAGLFDPAGRIVQDTVEVRLRTLPLLLGIKPRFDDGQAPEDQPALFDIQTVTPDGHGVATQNLAWRLIREQHTYDWFQTSGTWQWHAHTVDQPITNGTLSTEAGAPATLSQTLPWGDYRLIVQDPVTAVASSVRFSVGWASASNAADTPDKVSLQADKPSYAPGETAHLRVTAPFAGPAQLIIATDRVLETRTLTLPKSGATLTVPISGDWGAGAYAVLSLYRPLAAGGPHDPVRAIGVAWLGVAAPSRTLALTLDAPPVARPRQPLDVPIRVAGARPGDTVFATLAATDEGILQLTRFKSPDPNAYLFGKRRLGLDIRDEYGRLLDGSADAGPIHEGGDEGAGGPGLAVTSTRTIALFSGPLTVGADGVAHARLAIPDFEGELRLMAVAWSDHAVGHADTALTVRDPVVAEVSLPRFLAPGDTAYLAVLLHNIEAPAGAYTFACRFGACPPHGGPSCQLHACGRGTAAGSRHSRGDRRGDRHDHRRSHGSEDPACVSRVAACHTGRPLPAHLGNDRGTSAGAELYCRSGGA